MGTPTAAPPTIKDIAQRAGVSVSTVHYALRRTRPISEATRARVLAAVQELDYQPHAGAATLPTGRTGRIGVVIAGIDPAFANAYFSDFIRGLAAAAEAEDHTVVLYTAYGKRAAEGWRPVHVLRRREADGLVLIGTQFQPDHLDELADQGAACVLLNREHPGLASVHADRRQGSALGAAHLLHAGCWPLALVAADFPGGGPAGQRPELAGYQDALRAAGRPFDSSLVQFLRVSAARTADVAALFARVRAPGVAGQGQPGAGRPGLLVFSYTLGPAVYRAVAGAGLRVPQDLGLVAGDEDRDAAESLRVPLTVVRAPKFEMAQAAMQLLLRLVHGQATPLHQRFPMALHVRWSCGANQPAAGPRGPEPLEPLKA